MVVFIIVAGGKIVDESEESGDVLEETVVLSELVEESIVVAIGDGVEFPCECV